MREVSGEEIVRRTAESGGNTAKDGAGAVPCHREGGQEAAGEVERGAQARTLVEWLQEADFGAEWAEEFGSD